MRSFVELGELYQFAPVRSLSNEHTGYLHLDALHSKLVLSSQEFHHFDGDNNGWFDVEVEDGRGSKILLHNALTQSKSMPGHTKDSRVGSYTSEIFPNIVVVGSENLRKDRTLRRLTFTFEGAENFFVYDTIEWLSLHAQPNRKKLLKTIRDEAWKPPKNVASRNHVSDPHEVYIVHNPKTYLDFELEDMRVKVWHSQSRRGLGWTGHEIKLTPVVSVVFDKPISIDEGIHRIWRIKGFFEQLALTDLRMQSVGFSKFVKGYPSADVYLSNEVTEKQKSRLDVHPLHVPFSRWNERKSFSFALQKWLKLSDERRFFRAAIRLSLARLERENDPNLITLMLAGIESLSELGGNSGISKSTISQMAVAAHAIDSSIDLGAIKGLLGALARSGPKQRLRKLAKGLFSTTESEVEHFVAKSIEFRNKLAHGKWLSENERAAAGDLARVLTLLCILYDLRTSGFPAAKTDKEGRNLLADSRMGWAWQGYKSVGNEQPPKTL